MVVAIDGPAGTGKAPLHIRLQRIWDSCILTAAVFTAHLRFLQ